MHIIDSKLYYITMQLSHSFVERIVQCPRNITTVVSLETGLAAVEFISADGSPVELQLPPGIYPMNPPNGPSENNCSNTSVKIYGL